MTFQDICRKSGSAILRGTAGTILLLSLVLTANSVQAEWVLFDLFKTPIHDARGNVVASERVAKHRKPLYGAVILYPDMNGTIAMERYDTGKNLLVFFITPVDVKIERKTQYVTVNLVRDQKVIPQATASYGWSAFNARKVTDAEAEALKKAWGFVKETEPELGVTP